MNINYSFIMAALLMVTFDIITGVLAAFITGTFKSSIMRRGGLRKLFLCIVIAFGVVLDIVQKLADLGFSVPATSAISGYITLMEIMSVIENINLAFPAALPDFLTNILQSAAKTNGIEPQEKGKDDGEAEVH